MLQEDETAAGPNPTDLCLCGCGYLLPLLPIDHVRLHRELRQAKAAA